MIPWEEWLHFLPDENFDTLDQIIASMPVGAEFEMIWEQTPFFVLEVAEPTAAVYLRLACEDARPSYDDGTPLLAENQLWIGADEKPECERMLAENCPSAVVWRAVARMAFASDSMRRQFAAAWDAR